MPHAVPHFGLVLVTPPAGEPVITWKEAKAHLRLNLEVEETYVAALVKAATLEVERTTGRALLSQTWRLTLDAWPCVRNAWLPDEAIRLPRPPLQSVTFVKYVDPAGVLQTLATSEYQVCFDSEPARIVPAYSKSWPILRVQPEAVQVQYVAGYDSPAKVAQDLKQAILLIVGHWFRNREEVSELALKEIPLAAARLLRGNWHGSLD